jgi:LmbE family N-acetylglucosaminyl deacetylase
MTCFTSKQALVLAPHTDDGEFGCGGTISRLIEEGTDVFYMAFSVCEQSVPYGFSETELETELLEATKVLGIPTDHVIVRNYQVRKFPEFRQDILQNIIDLKKSINPDLVFIPCTDDLHQDHQVIAAEGIRAFKDKTILSYEMPWNNLSITTSAFSILKERHVATKIKALACYKTQSFRPYADPVFIRSLAVTRGVQVADKFAEAFQLVRLIL